MKPRRITLQMCGMGLLLWAAFGCGQSSDSIAVGSVAPSFSVTSVSDTAKTVNLKDFAGKVVLLDFWATWCGPCRGALPHIEEVWKNNKDKGLEVLAITKENSFTVKGFQGDTKLEMPFYMDEAGEANTAFNITGLPTTVVIGKDGKVVYSSMGTSPIVEEQIDAAVAAALK